MRIHLILTGILIAVFAIYGQERPRLEQRLEQLKTSLQLTDQQSKQVEQILNKTAKEAEKLREQNRRQQQEMHAAHLRLIDQTESQIANILTEEQKKKFDLYKKNGVGTKRLMRLQQRLNLNTDQTYKIGQIISESKDKMLALHEKESSREARYKAMLSLKKETDNKITALLNEEQRAEYDKLKQRFWTMGHGFEKHAKKGHKQWRQKPRN